MPTYSMKLGKRADGDWRIAVQTNMFSTVSDPLARVFNVDVSRKYRGSELKPDDFITGAAPMPSSSDAGRGLSIEYYRTDEVYRDRPLYVPVNTLIVWGESNPS